MASVPVGPAVLPVRDEREYLALAARRMGEFVGAEATASQDPQLIVLDLHRPALTSELGRHRAERESPNR